MLVRRLSNYYGVFSRRVSYEKKNGLDSFFSITSFNFQNIPSVDGSIDGSNLSQTTSSEPKMQNDESKNSIELKKDLDNLKNITDIKQKMNNSMQEERNVNWPNESKSESLNDDVANNRIQSLIFEFEEARTALTRIPEVIKHIPLRNPLGIYANHNLRLDRISIYGFDYDYTLAHYTKDLHELIYNLAKTHLVNELRYPDECLEFEYDSTFPIRGLYYDRKKGYLLKLNFFHSVEAGACYFGRRKVSQVELNSEYGGSHISVDHMTNLSPILDLFALSETCLISDVIQHFVDRGLDFDPSYVYEDVKKCFQHVHSSQTMHKHILENPSKYLMKNSAVIDMLKSLKRKGKKMFLLTNSSFPFVDGGMRYQFQDDDIDGESWREVFDVVIAMADKPNFYHSQRPFRLYNSEKDSLTFNKVECFSSEDVYYHGCLKEFLNITKWEGSEVLYCGDQVYNDLRGPQRAGWRTAAIIHELEEEISTMNSPKYRYQQAKYHVIQELLGKFHNMSEEFEKDEKKLFFALQALRMEARNEMRNMFNSYFGSAFLTCSGKESAFAYNVNRYADVYTSRIENFMLVSSQSWLYTPYDVKILPHHIKVAPWHLIPQDY